MRMILEAIYEPIFLNTSFGFRPNLGPHDALNMIEQRFSGMKFAVEGDIKGMYDNVNHHKLIELLRKRISDERFIRLVWKMIRNEDMEKEQPGIKPVMGTPQGSILSSILANIYLHEMDRFMEDRIKRLETHKQTVTPAYRSRTRQIENILISNCKPGDAQRKNLLKERKTRIHKRAKTRCNTGPNNRICYVRYANDFIIAIAGNAQFAQELKNNTQKFLKETLFLELNEENTKITNLRKNWVLFLGHRIFMDTGMKFKYVQSKGKRRSLKRVTGWHICIQPPVNHIVSRLWLKGFCTAKGWPTQKKTWTTQEDNQIIHNFNATTAGIFGYYSGVSKPYYLGRI